MGWRYGLYLAPAVERIEVRSSYRRLRQPSKLPLFVQPWGVGHSTSQQAQD